MNILKGNSKYYFIINASLVLSIIVPFIITLLCFNINSMKASETINIKDIVPFLRFISVGKLNSMLNLAMHNFILASIAYLLSMLTLGISGIPSLITSSFIFAVTIKTSPNLLTIVFVILEALGMTLANFYGTYIGIRRKNDLVEMKKIGIQSCIILFILLIIYVIGAFIESGLIYGLY